MSQEDQKIDFTNKQIVGIDLGTTNSVIAGMVGDKAVVIPNAEGSRTTSSVVGFTKKGETLIGQIAKRQAVMNIENTFYSIKRFIGITPDEVKLDLSKFSYPILSESNRFQVKSSFLDKTLNPEEISSYILRKLAQDASEFLGFKVENAVITVPAYFNDSQRQSTKDAATIAGLKVARLVNEPTAAALSYGVSADVTQRVLVFDLGGGTFDVTVLEIDKTIFEVQSTAGDVNLGGDNFDQRIVDYIIESFQDTYKLNLRENKQALQRIIDASEKAKIELSSLLETKINIPFITATETGPKHIDMTLTREKFEGLCEDLINRCEGPFDKALKDGSVSKKDIDEIVLVGGSTRIPAIQNLIEKLVGKKPDFSVNPDEAVAIGAALQGAIISGSLGDIMLIDVLPLSLGVEVEGGLTSRMITRNSAVPTDHTETYTTPSKNYERVTITVLQGEREFARDNKKIGEFELSGLKPSPMGKPSIDVKFEVDENCTLNVTAIDLATKSENSIVIKDTSQLSSDEIAKMVSEGESWEREDKKKRLKVELSTQALSEVRSAKELLEANTLPETQTKKLEEFITYFETETSLLKSEVENITFELEQRYKQKLRELANIIGECEALNLKLENDKVESEIIEPEIIDPI